MDQTKTDKFAELSPVLELVYVMLTNMAKYMDVYAVDIDAEKTTQYVEAKEALKFAIGKFDVLYGLKSISSAPEELEEERETEVEAPTTMPELTPTPTHPEAAAEAQPYDFASGSDPESLKKAKQAVEELKLLFADMKKQEAVLETPVDSIVEATPFLAQTAPEEFPAPMPTFVAPVTPPQMAEVPVATESVLPTPMDAPAPVQDATEIDSILAELKKLQNKGTPQL